MILLPFINKTYEKRATIIWIICCISCIIFPILPPAEKESPITM